MCWGMLGATPRHPGGIYNDTLLLHHSRGVSAAPTSWLSPWPPALPQFLKLPSPWGQKCHPDPHPRVPTLPSSSSLSCCLWRCLWPRGLCCLSPRQSPSAGWCSLRGCVCGSSQWAAWVSQRTCPWGLASDDAARVASAVCKRRGAFPAWKPRQLLKGAQESHL